MPEQPRTRLEQVLRQRHWTVGDLRRRYAQASGTELSERQAYRWVGGELRSVPYPHACAALERVFGEPVERLLGPPQGVVIPGRRPQPTPLEDTEPAASWHRPVLAASADRAREFLMQMEVSNVGSETLDQLADDVRRLVVDYQLKPLGTLLGDLADTQDRAFTLLEGRQRPKQTRDLYLLAGVSSGLMAKASHDLGSPHEAMTQVRAACTCADNAGHNGLLAWARGLQALIAYWAGHLAESVRYARRGAEAAARTPGTSAVWLAAGEARALAASGHLTEAHDAVHRAADARERATGDDLDDLGGLCTFTRPRQLYYAADALAWAGAAEAEHAERLALEALSAYQAAPETDRAFGDQAGTRCALAVARIERGEIDGAAEAVAPVLDLPAAQRIHGIVASVDHVHRTLARVDGGQAGSELGDRMRAFATDRLVITP
jgi:tetratricopeptide (TPR) repeat protein